MSHRSRRFLASKEDATLPTAVGRSGSQNENHKPKLVPSLQAAVDAQEDGSSLSTTMGKLKDTVSQEVDAHGGAGFLEHASKQITDMTSKVVVWAKQHPMRVASAAAALIAVSGVLYKLIHRRTKKAGGVVRAAKRVKAGVKARVNTKMKALTGRKTGSKRPKLAMA